MAGEIGSGEITTVPPGVIHMWWNPNDEPAEVVDELSPAFDTETMCETIFGLARDGQVNPSNPSSGMPLQLMVIGRDFRREIALPPPFGPRG